MRPPNILTAVRRRLNLPIRRHGQERSADWYDRVFSRSRVYQTSYHDSPYYVLWALIVDRIRRDKLGRVLDIGCGTGQLAAFLFDNGIQEYVGIDFSGAAIAQARKAAPRGRFLVDDARRSDVYLTVAHDVLVCTEVLEHIEDDFAVVSNFKPGVRCLLSVPSYPSEGHVRHFADERAVTERYTPYFDGLDVMSLPVPQSEANRFFLADGYRNALSYVRRGDP
jgi:SAM-dependent methyltransferase